MQLQHPTGAGSLVEPVDVLGDDGRQLACPFPGGEGPVGRVRLRVGVQQVGAIVGEELLRVALEEAMTEDLLGGVAGCRRLVVQPPAGPEIGDSALGRHSGAAEEDDPRAVVHDAAQVAAHGATLARGRGR